MTPESKHTPGPWWANSMQGYINSLWVECDGGNIANVEWGEGLAFNEARANARLIAAAPDMLAALKELIAPLGPGGYHTAAGKPATDRARAAIAKAESA